MIIYVNECCDCEVPAYPCLGSSCPNRNVEHYLCDECNEETQLYEWEGQELCIDCIEQLLTKVN